MEKKGMNPCALKGLKLYEKIPSVLNGRSYKLETPSSHG